MKKHFNIMCAFIFVVMALFFAKTGLAQELSGDLVVFHAGSLTIPFREMFRVFRQKHPQVKILAEAAGSRNCARKITDLERRCDVMASADYTVIEELLIPEHADWNLNFASNEMAIMYRKDSKFADTITSDNWPEVLLRQGVEYGHSEPNADPCGYRSQLVWQLSQMYYKIPNLYHKLVKNCPKRNIRPKETDLIALLEAGELDYLFIYRSICEQHKMPYINLPEQISLKSAKHNSFYKQARIKVTGETPGTFIEKKGGAMVYGVTIPKNAPNYKAAIAFVKLITSPQGQSIMAQNGQPPIIPAQVSGNHNKLPPELRP